MPARKKSNHRNSGGRRNSTTPPYSIDASLAQLEDSIAATELAMAVAARYNGRIHERFF